MKTSLCLMVYNELEGCKIDIPCLPYTEFDEIYAVDGGSTDGTVEYLQSNNIKVYKQPHKGLNAAYIYANQLSNCDAVVAFFPKGTLPTSDLCKFRPLFVAGYKLVIASRQLTNSVNEEDMNLFKPRKWSVLLLSIFARIIWQREGYWVRDVLHGFKGWNRLAFAQMNILEDGLSIDIEMVVRAYKLKIKRTEFATTEKSRHYGETHFKFWPTGKKLLSYCWYELNRKC